MHHDVTDKTAIITGGAQGIGRAIAGAFLNAGMKVVIADKDAEAFAETVRELSRRGVVVGFPTDVSQESSVVALVRDTLTMFRRIDVLINNAGLMITKPIQDLSLDEWNSVLSANLTGMFLCAKHCAPHLISAKGAIVNIASTRALMSEPHTESYAASKGGVVSLTHALAVSLGPHVRVNCISPGWIDVSPLKKSSVRLPANLTPADHQQHPCGRVGTPDDIAALALYLISDAAGFITGQDFVVDGGMTRKMMYV